MSGSSAPCWWLQELQSCSLWFFRPAEISDCSYTHCCTSTFYYHCSLIPLCELCLRKQCAAFSLRTSPPAPFFLYILFFKFTSFISRWSKRNLRALGNFFFTRPPLPWDENNSWRLVSSWTSALRLRGPSARCVDWQIAHTTCCVTPSCPLWYIARVKYHSEGSPGIKSTFKNLLHAPFISILWLFMGYCHAGMVCAVLWKKFCKRNTLFKKKGIGLVYEISRQGF